MEQAPRTATSKSASAAKVRLTPAAMQACREGLARCAVAWQQVVLEELAAVGVIPTTKEDLDKAMLALRRVGLFVPLVEMINAAKLDRFELRLDDNVHTPDVLRAVKEGCPNLTVLEVRSNYTPNDFRNVSEALLRMQASFKEIYIPFAPPPSRRDCPNCATCCRGSPVSRSSHWQLIVSWSPQRM